MTKRYLTLILIFCVQLLSAQEVYQTNIFNKNIKSLQLYLNGFELSGPFVDLKGSNSLALHFDELGTDFKNYQYSLVHCNSDWTMSSLLPQEYIDGYYEDYINSYSTSFNTYQEYLHYTVNLPNENMRLKKSGNYIVKVYEVGKSESPSFQMRFVVFENASRVVPMIKRSDIVAQRDFLQEIDFNVIPPFTMANPFTDLKVTILQDRRWDNAITGLTPTFVRENEIIFNYDLKGSFPGGNEYRNVDLKTFKYQTARVAKILNSEGSIKVKLINDLPRDKFPYSTLSDINGGYIIKNEDGTGNSITDADYALVTFTLPYKDPVSSGVIYVSGDFTQNRFTDETQMKYNYDIGAYECTLLMKQGYYNYQYVLVKDREKPTSAPIEGTFFQTENDYTILLYFRDFAADYDRVIGCYTANSLRGN